MGKFEVGIAESFATELETNAEKLKLRAARMELIARFIREKEGNLTLDQLRFLRSWLDHSDPLDITAQKIIEMLKEL